MSCPIHKLDTFTLPSLLIIAALLAAACNGGGSSGNDNANDAGIDASPATPDAWTYECPTDQPTDHVCIRGQVRDFVTGEPVTVPEDSLMTMRAARNKDDFPNELEAEVVVQPDGRFIFPSVEQYLVQEFYDDRIPEFIYAYYHLFSLMIDTEITAYRIADNRHGVDFYDTELTYYVISVGTIDAWEENWLWKPGEVPDELILDVDASFKTLIGLCYGHHPLSTPPTPDDGECAAFRPEHHLVEGTTLQLESDRLHFLGPGSVPQDCTGMSVSYLHSELLGPQRVSMSCDYYHMARPALGQIGPVDVDDSGQLVVIHGPMIEN